MSAAASIPEIVLDTPTRINLPNNHQYVLGFDRRYAILRVCHDADMESPLDIPGNGAIYSLSRRHSNGDAQAVHDALKYNPDAVPLSYYEHGDSLWFVQGTTPPPGVEFQFDGVESAGVWVPDVDGSSEPEIAERMKSAGISRAEACRQIAAHICEEYTHYINGEAYQYIAEVYENDDREAPVETFSCSGFDDYNACIEDALEEIGFVDLAAEAPPVDAPDVSTAFF